MRIPGRRRADPEPPQQWDGDESRPDGGRELAVPPEHWRDLELRAEITAAARTRRTPITMAAATALVGTGSWGTVQTVALIGGAEAGGAAGAVVVGVTALGVPILRTVLRERIPDRWARRWWVSTWSAAAWVDLVATRGADLLTVDTGGWMVSLLVIGAAAIGGTWYKEHQVRYPADETAADDLPAAPPVPALPQVDTSRAADIEADWEDSVAGGPKPVAAGSILLCREELPYGWRWLVQLDRTGDVGATEMETEQTVRAVARRFGMRHTHVILERLDGPGDREDQVTLTVVTRDVLAEGVSYAGPDYRRGLIRIGRYADGTGDAVWTACNDSGTKGGLVVGEPGSGKSALMAALGLSYRASGEWVVLFGDGDENGNSSRLLASVAHDFACGATEVLQQLEAVEALARVRGPLMGTLTWGPDRRPTPITRRGQQPVDKILPCPEYPGVVWFLDEFHLLAGDPMLRAANFVERVAKAVRLLRKYGGGFVVGTQSAMSDDFDGDSAFRGMLVGGNVITLRSKNKTEQGIVTDGLDPSALPKGAGYALQGDAGRRAMIRTADPTTMPEWVPHAIERGAVPDARSWAAYRRYRPVQTLDPDAEHAEKVAQLAAFDEAITTGAPLPGSPEARDAEQDEADGPAGDDLEVSVGGFGLPTLAPVVSLFPDTPPPAPTERGERPAPALLPAKAVQMLNLLRSRPGPWRAAEVAEGTGMSGSDVSRMGGLLIDRGEAHRPSGRQGSYAAGPAPDQLRDREAI